MHDALLAVSVPTQAQHPELRPPGHIEAATSVEQPVRCPSNPWRMSASPASSRLRASTLKSGPAAAPTADSPTLQVNSAVPSQVLRRLAADCGTVDGITGWAYDQERPPPQQLQLCGVPYTARSAAHETALDVVNSMIRTILSCHAAGNGVASLQKPNSDKVPYGHRRGVVPVAWARGKEMRSLQAVCQRTCTLLLLLPATICASDHFSVSHQIRLRRRRTCCSTHSYATVCVDDACCSIVCARQRYPGIVPVRLLAVLCAQLRQAGVFNRRRKSCTEHGEIACKRVTGRFTLPCHMLTAFVKADFSQACLWHPHRHSIAL